jgi:lysophospholipase L1-like esterase
MRSGIRLVVILALLATSVMATAASAAARQEKLYLALGESTQAGVGASEPGNGLAALFFQHLDRVNAADRFVNLAVPGETSSTMQAGPHSQLAQALDAIDDRSTDVTVVTLGLGGNDVPFDFCLPEPASPECLEAFDAAMRAFTRNLYALLQQLAPALGRDPGIEQLILMTYYQPFGGTGLPFEDGFDVLWQGPDLVVGCTAQAGHRGGIFVPADAGLNDVINCVGRRYGATIVDLFALFGDRAPELTHIADFDVHPNDPGHTLIAAALADAYQPRSPGR